MSQKLSKNDCEELELRKLESADWDRYRGILESGYPYIKLANICRRGKEIKTFSDQEKASIQRQYTEQKNLQIVKFVPASGAASRMFKDLFTALETGHFSENTDQLFANIARYAFAKEWLTKAEISEKKHYTTDEKKRLLSVLLSSEGMNYAGVPKGMIGFHRYSDGSVRTAFEEHFYEGALYARSGDKTHLHFTIPAENQTALKAYLNSLADRLKPLLKTDFIIQTSIQEAATDTPAIYAESGEWVRTATGSFLFRPAGHGALLENLNAINADLVFVKNIDNVVPDTYKAITVANKQLLAGVLLNAQKELFEYLRALDNENLDISKCSAFTRKWFGYNLNGVARTQIRKMLNRPVRVCGMVKNEGEPGGGPFMIAEEWGQSSYQIVESAQIDSTNSAQTSMARNATHFNPVDLVLGTKDYKGKPFNLLDYRNDNTGMVVSKNYMGQPIKALELPGLWNGSMHHWNTIFVEVPIATFNPVKTVFDLSRELHQGK